MRFFSLFWSICISTAVLETHSAQLVQIVCLQVAVETDFARLEAASH